MGNINAPAWCHTAGRSVVGMGRRLPLSLFEAPGSSEANPRALPAGTQEGDELSALRERARAMEVLYTLSTSSERCDDLETLLSGALGQLMRATGAAAGVVRRMDGEGTLRLVAALGVGEEYPENDCGVRPEDCACGEAALRGCLISNPRMRGCRHMHYQRPLGREDLHLLAVPLTADDRRLGVFSLFLEPRMLQQWQQLNLHRMLEMAGEHLGLAMARIMRDSEARLQSVEQERSQLTHELHDCLAQRLAALGLEVRSLEATHGGGRASAGLRAGLRHVRRGLDQANGELRQLMGQFRIALEGGGLEPALKRLVHRFQRDSGIRVLLRYDWPRGRLSPDQEFQVLRIVQEALNNVRNHSGARHVQVAAHRIGCDLELVVEDDGRGFADPRPERSEDEGGHHLGLGVMRDRAHGIGGRLSVQSEPGEGVRVSVFLPNCGHCPSGTGGRQCGS